MLEGDIIGARVMQRILLARRGALSQSAKKMTFGVCWVLPVRGYCSLDVFQKWMNLERSPSMLTRSIEIGIFGTDHSFNHLP